VGVGIAGPSLRCSNLRTMGWVTGCFSFFGPKSVNEFFI
jgi:hypothetical protein